MCYKKFSPNPQENKEHCYFKEKLNRIKVNKIDHYEDCAQLFESVSRMHVVEAALTFFDMETLDDEQKMNSISDAFMSSDVEKKCIFENMMKFVEEFTLALDKTHECDDQISSTEQPDRIKAYALNYLKQFLLCENLNDAVKEGDGPRLATLSKVLQLHFKQYMVLTHMPLK